MLNSCNSLVIISHYNEDLSWTKKLLLYGYKYVVYDKCNPLSSHTIPLNKGLEASSYLKFIIDNYFNLPDYLIFIHADEYSWHHNGSIVEILNDYKGFDKFFININDQKFKLSGKCIQMIDWWSVYFESELGPMESYGDWMDGHLQGAQFIVHKNLILKRSLSFYKSIYLWLLETKLKNSLSARWLEWSWHLIWGQVTIKAANFITDRNIYSIARDKLRMNDFARQIIGSDYKVIPDIEFVCRLYNRILDRDPDQAGFKSHMIDAYIFRDTGVRLTEL